MFSTILFVDGMPVKFFVIKNNGEYVMYPHDNPYRVMVPDEIKATWENGTWEISGTHDQNLVDQIIEDISLMVI